MMVSDKFPITIPVIFTSKKLWQELGMSPFPEFIKVIWSFRDLLFNCLMVFQLCTQPLCLQASDHHYPRVLNIYEPTAAQRSVWGQNLLTLHCQASLSPQPLHPPDPCLGMRNRRSPLQLVEDILDFTKSLKIMVEISTLKAAFFEPCDYMFYKSWTMHLTDKEAT